MKIISLLILLFPILLSGQTYISPIIGGELNRVKNDLNSGIFTPALENHMGSSYFLGIELQQHFTSRFKVSLSFSRVKFDFKDPLDYRPEASETINLEPKYIERTTIIKNRYRLNASARLLDNLYFDFGFSYEDMVNLITHKNFASGSGKIKKQSDYQDHEFGYKLGLSYTFKHIDFGLYYYQGFKRDIVFLNQFDPIKSIGFKLGYRFKIIDKGRFKKKQVECPKL